MEEALDLLEQLGIPLERLTGARKAHLARVFLSLAGLTTRKGWAELQDADTHQLSTKRILAYGREHWGEKRSDGSYDDVRRQDLKLLTLSGVVIAAANKPGATTNDGTRGYGIHPVVAAVARMYATPQWAGAIDRFRKVWPSLTDELARRRELEMLPVTLPNGETIRFKPDPHNRLQELVISKFLPFFGHGAEVLYVGDATEKAKVVDEAYLKELGMFELGHEELPDIVAYSKSRNWLYLIEAVTTANPVTEERRLTLERRLAACKAERIYVTAFLDRPSFRKFAASIAWETEAWVADAPEHLVHFNGNKFLGPHK